MDKQVVSLVLPTVKRGAWYAFSENIIQTLLCSDNSKDRITAVNFIRSIWGPGNPEFQLGSSIVRPRRTPNINERATNLIDLIDWKKGIFEPPLTISITTKQLEDFLLKPMQVNHWVCHNQPMERVIKQVGGRCLIV